MTILLMVIENLTKNKLKSEKVPNTSNHARHKSNVSLLPYVNQSLVT